MKDPYPNSPLTISCDAIVNPTLAGQNFSFSEIAGSANVASLDPELRSDEIATKLVENIELDTVLSNSFGFGGTNASLAIGRYLG